MTVYEPPRNPIAAANRRLVRWRPARPITLHFSKPVVSFTFDDFPRTAASVGAGILEAAGGRGTFYASAGLAGLESPMGDMFTAEEIVRLRSRGHEIGCHTFRHDDAGQVPPDFVLADMEKNAHALGEMGLNAPLVSFAYPYGETTIAMKAALPQRFSSARGIAPGLNIGPIDLAQLRANALYGPNAEARCVRLLKSALRRNAWVIFFAHDVGMRPSRWGVETRLLERLVGGALAQGAEMAPVGEVVARALAAAQLQ